MSDWTIDSLKEHFEALLAASDKRHEQRFLDMQEAVKAALASQQEGQKAALASAERAVERAEVTNEKWRVNANEWRGAMSDRERSLMPRAEAEKSITANAEKIEALSKRIERSEGRSGGLDKGWVILLGAVSLIATIIGILMLVRGR